ncbi:iron chelate uptake ABC transporter family permease subunit, partial [Staphylococcus hominis]
MEKKERFIIENVRMGRMIVGIVVGGGLGVGGLVMECITRNQLGCRE